MIAVVQKSLVQRIVKGKSAVQHPVFTSPVSIEFRVRGYAGMSAAQRIGAVQTTRSFST